MQKRCGLEYEQSGEGEAVLFIHGALVADEFAPLMKEEALRGYRLIRYRRRGYGDSALPDERTIEEHARDALALLEDLGEACAHVVAHSGGGPIAVQMAACSPTVVRSLVLLEPALQTAAMAEAFDGLVAPLVELHRRGERSKAVHLWMRSGGGPAWRAEIERAIPGAAGQAEADAAGTFEGDLPALRHWDFDSVRDRVTQPVLYVVGSMSGPLVGHGTSMFCDAVPTSELVVVDGANHTFPITRPAATAEVVADFLCRQSELSASRSNRSVE